LQSGQLCPLRKALDGVSVRQVLIEAVLVGLAGAVVAFAANELSPQGLKLTTDYFPGTSQARSSPGKGTNRTTATQGSNSPALSSEEILAARLKQNGLQLIGTDEVVKLFHDPRYEQDLVVFVDARPDNQYHAEHIPGAYQFDHYHPENYFATILPVCQVAQQIVVYCHGGECVDSESAAIILTRDAGIPKEKVFVYGGGINEWTARGLPVEIGARKSGKLSNEKK
jgi:rhodanese-related sulfurtransferase